MTTRCCGWRAPIARRRSRRRAIYERADSGLRREIRRRGLTSGSSLIKLIGLPRVIAAAMLVSVTPRGKPHVVWHERKSIGGNQWQSPLWRRGQRARTPIPRNSRIQSGGAARCRRGWPAALSQRAAARTAGLSEGRARPLRHTRVLARPRSAVAHHRLVARARRPASQREGRLAHQERPASRSAADLRASGLSRRPHQFCRRQAGTLGLRRHGADPARTQDRRAGAPAQRNPRLLPGGGLRGR